MHVETPIFDAAIVPGRGFTKEFSLPASSISTVEKAVELYKTGIVPFVIFSGKYSWRENTTPPLKTEAKAMAEYAEELGLSETAILLEEDSQTTVANLCLVKEEFFIPRKWNKGVIIGVYPHTNRIKLNAEYVFGPSYSIEVVATTFTFPPPIHDKLIEMEEQKLENAKVFLAQFEKGDHKAIFAAAQEDLQNRLVTR